MSFSPPSNFEVFDCLYYLASRQTYCGPSAITRQKYCILWKRKVYWLKQTANSMVLIDYTETILICGPIATLFKTNSVIKDTPYSSWTHQPLWRKRFKILTTAAKTSRNWWEFVLLLKYDVIVAIFNGSIFQRSFSKPIVGVFCWSFSPVYLLHGLCPVLTAFF